MSCPFDLKITNKLTEITDKINTNTNTYHKEYTIKTFSSSEKDIST